MPFFTLSLLLKVTLSLTGSSDKALNASCMWNFIPHDNIKLWICGLFYNSKTNSLWQYHYTSISFHRHYSEVLFIILLWKAGFRSFGIFGAFSSKFSKDISIITMSEFLTSSMFSLKMCVCVYIHVCIHIPMCLYNFKEKAEKSFATHFCFSYNKMTELQRIRTLFPQSMNEMWFV